jgi:hypothetical protein
MVALAAAVLLFGGLARAGEETEKKGLTAKLVKRKTTRRFRGRERTFDMLILQVKNEGKETVLLPSPLVVKLKAKDAEGKEVATREDPRAAQKKEDPGKAVEVTVLKAGQTSETTCRTWTLSFTKVGKYKLWAEVELKPSEKEILPGLKLWSGKLKSDEIEWEVTRVRGGDRGGNRQPRGEQKPAEKKPTEKQPVEDF